MALSVSPVFLVVMGVAGCGKSSLGKGVAQACGLPFLEGDDFHAAENVRKMRSGTPLDDTDRAAWLDALASRLKAHPQGAVLTCSALRRRYRDRLRQAVPGLRFLFLSLSEAEARERVAARSAHLFPVSLVASQFEALEDPGMEPGVLTLNACQTLASLERDAVQWLAPRAHPTR